MAEQPIYFPLQSVLLLIEFLRIWFTWFVINRKTDIYQKPLRSGRNYNCIDLVFPHWLYRKLQLVSGNDVSASKPWLRVIILYSICCLSCNTSFIRLVWHGHRVSLDRYLELVGSVWSELRHPTGLRHLTSEKNSRLLRYFSCDGCDRDVCVYVVLGTTVATTSAVEIRANLGIFIGSPEKEGEIKTLRASVKVGSLIPKRFVFLVALKERSNAKNVNCPRM